MVVNIGVYDPSSMQEKHEFGLILASNKLDAKNIAISKCLFGCKKKHKDDITSVKMQISCDDCQLMNKIDNWEVKLTPVNNPLEQNNNPDWYGYQKIGM